MASVSGFFDGLGSILDTAANRYIDQQFPVQEQPSNQQQYVNDTNGNTHQSGVPATSRTGGLLSSLPAVNWGTLAVFGAIAVVGSFIIYKTVK